MKFDKLVRQTLRKINEATPITLPNIHGYIEPKPHKEPSSEDIAQADYEAKREDVLTDPGLKAEDEANRLEDADLPKLPAGFKYAEKGDLMAARKKSTGKYMTFFFVKNDPYAEKSRIFAYEGEPKEGKEFTDKFGNIYTTAKNPKRSWFKDERWGYKGFIAQKVK